MTSSSRLIRAGSPADVAVAWRAPDVARAAARAGATQSDPESLARQAWQQGFEQGRTAGLEAGASELNARTTALERVLDALARPLEDLDNRIETELLALVQAVVRQLIRRELAADPSHVVGVLRQALGALPLAAGDAVVRLHPDDAEVIRQCLPADGIDRAWRIETDPLQERGGCLVTTARSTVDARLDVRLGRIISSLLDDSRDDAG